MKLFVFFGMALFFLVVGCAQEQIKEAESAEKIIVPEKVVEKQKPTEKEEKIGEAEIVVGEEKFVESTQKALEGVDKSQIFSVLPADRIPAIDNPKFETVAKANWPEEALMLVASFDGETKAYPINILTWHEIVNDTIGKQKIAISYCPLCFSGIAFERIVNGRELTFGTSGSLYQNNLVMYDRQTNSLWYQAAGQAISGELEGSVLKRLPLRVMKWKAFKALHPNALVLSRDTGHIRDYGNDPYEGYYYSGEIGIRGQTDYDTRLGKKEFVFGISINKQSKAYPFSRLPEQGTINDSLGGEPIVIYSHRSAGFRSAFSRDVDGKTLTFKQAEPFTFVDEQTQSVWNADSGEAIEGKLKGKRLARVILEPFFWFSWADSHPGTKVFGE